MEPLAKLFGSPARLKILRLFVFNQTISFSIDDISGRTKLSANVVRHELIDLIASSLIRKKGVRAAASYQVNPRFEHLVHLNTFIRETTSVSPQNIMALIRRAGALKLVVLSGFFVGLIEPQIDLLVIGDTLDERALSAAVRSLEAELGREIRYASFATPDFRYRLEVYDRLLRDVFDYPHRVLIDRIGL